MKIYTCKNCGKEYNSNKQNSKFCSIECRRKYNQLDYNCDFCGKPMVIYRNQYEKLLNGEKEHLYCSKECVAKSQTKKILKICENCGSEYEIGQCFADIQKFCSKECYKDYLSKHSKSKTVICKQCKNIFITTRDNQQYCSYKCAEEAQQNRKTCKCETCGKTFERRKSEVDKNRHHYCSVACKLDAIKWNQHDLNILKEFYNKISITDIQLKLSKKWSKKAIQAKSQSLGLGKSKKWSPEEENILKQNYPTKSMSEVLELLNQKSFTSILSKAHSMGLTSKFYNDRIYTDNEILFLKENYMLMNDLELAERLNNKHSENAIHQKLYNLGCVRPVEIKKDGYINLNRFVRERLTTWKNDVREYNNYTCCITGSHSNLIIHHCRSFNLLFDEVVDILNFKLKDNFSDYTDDELILFVDKFLELQDYYGQYVCITGKVHKLFHKEYGYGDNTVEQWNEFVDNYKNGKYLLIA